MQNVVADLCKIRNANCKIQNTNFKKIQNAKCKMQNSKCKMQNAKCKIQNAKCKIQNSKCKSFTAWQFPIKDQSWCKGGGKQGLQKLKIQNGMLLASTICAKYKFKIGNAKFKMQKKTSFTA